MSRKGCPNKIQSGITYPRKCNHCDYVSNNPSMYHYHKRTHDPIPENTCCQFGCGNKALFRNTNGRYTCKEKWAECPAYVKELAERTKKSWVDATERKAKTKEKFFTHCCNAPEVAARRKETLKEKWRDFTPEQMKDFRHYARRIRTRAQKWAKEQGYVLGQQTYHVDHKFSVWESWKANLSESVVNHPANLEIIAATANSSKGAKCSITLEELLELTKS